MDVTQIIALGLLIVVGLSLLGSIVSNNSARNAAVWVLIFVGVTAVSSQWDEISRNFYPQQTTFTDGAVEVPKGPDNHFRLTLQINDVPVEFLVDTGASQMVLTLEDAARVGLDPDTLPFIGTAFTANGEVATAPVRLDRVQLGEITDTRFRAAVNSGEMESSLLGMSYLSRFESIEITPDALILRR